MKKRLLSLSLAIFLILSTVCMALPLSAQSTKDIVILYTNDTHTYIDKDLAFDNIAAMKKDLSAENHVLLVDAGDHIQGTAYGAMDEGMTIVSLMNMAGYDAATLGNHEFDYNIDGAFAAINAANYTYLSCNFRDMRTGKTVLDSYRLFDFEGTKVAIIGISTPETKTSSAPVYFQDSEGNYIYDFDGCSNEADLYASVQAAIDSAKAEGADYIIGLGHLGVDPASLPYTSRNVIANTAGLDALIDGHSHTTIASEGVTDKNGKTVLLTQTGSYFDAVGKLTITKDGQISTALVSEYANSDANVESALTNWVNSVEALLGEKIAYSHVDFSVYAEDGSRIVRSMETNMASLNADSYYYYLNEVEKLDCDVAIINGGGVRDNAPAGDWSYKTMKTVNPFGNVICLMEISGQQLLDALEWGARDTTGKTDSPECGGFLNAAGVTYEINTSIASTVQSREGIWTGAPTEGYRVSNVKVYDKDAGEYLPLDTEKKYTFAGANYTLRHMGDGFNMFAGATLVKDYIVEDYLALSEYAKAFKDTDGDGYADITSANSPLADYKSYLLGYESIYGGGRVNFTDGKTVLPETQPKPGTEMKPASPQTDDSIVILLPLVLISLTAASVITIRKKKHSKS